MSNPKYILKTSESIEISVNPRSDKVKKAVALVCIVLFVGSFLLGDNLFGELSFMPRILLVGLVIGCLFGSKKEERKFPIEIHFYDDIIEIHRMEVHYSNGEVKRELHRFFLADNPRVTYDYRNKYVTIKGLAHGEWYLYSKNGVLNSKPERVSDTKGICYFYVADSNIDIVREIEEHSTLHVNRVNI